MKINHVMGNSVQSSIFDAFIGYFKKYAPPSVEHFVSPDPIEGCDVYHHHRPHISKSIPQNSVCTVHHDPKDHDGWLNLEQFIAAYRDSAAVVCLNSEQERLLSSRHQIDNTVVIPHGINTEVFNDKVRVRLRDEKVTLGFFSRRYGRGVKGEFRLYEIAKRLPPERFRFFLVGKDRLVDAKKLESMGFEVDCYEFLPYRLMPDAYARIDALLILSNFEGGPACIPEAVYTQTPIFSTRVGMAVDYVRPSLGENGLFIDQDLDVAAEDISDFFALKKSLSFTSVLSWQDVVSNYHSVYQAVVEKNESRYFNLGSGSYSQKEFFQLI
ncbi:glycosyltransferase family 4 protein [Microbulbifer celer]|uniref:Glycosyltransferase family 4 protein n=1 Tax=Microbulbifer celer TaxID=435905 RepID=A0ABW3UBU1_9GAMM|nr:glycosyltransferase family 4 protein [Microbulbifer celer]UFN58981.1 glycosyltransferase family 4 protein [Microbulbifer celer]